MRFFRRRSNAALAASVPEGGLRRFLEAPVAPPGTRLEDARLLAVDLETTGLDARTDHILSVGTLAVDGTRIPFGTAESYLVDQGVDVGQSAVIHQLTDDEVRSTGVPIEQALDRVFGALAGRVLLAHHVAVEEGFLRAAVRRLYGIDVTIPSVDTMALGLRALGDAEDLPRDAARLWRLRARAGLPSYRGHDALTDALACAELYLALTQELRLTTLGAAARG